MCCFQRVYRSRCAGSPPMTPRNRSKRWRNSRNVSPHPIRRKEWPRARRKSRIMIGAGMRQRKIQKPMRMSGSTRAGTKGKPKGDGSRVLHLASGPNCSHTARTILLVVLMTIITTPMHKMTLAVAALEWRLPKHCLHLRRFEKLKHGQPLRSTQFHHSSLANISHPWSQRIAKRRTI